MLRVETLLSQKLGTDLSSRIFTKSKRIEDLGDREKFLESVWALLEKEDSTIIHGLKWKGRPPVDPRTFILDKYYLGKSGEIYPEVLKHFIRINSGDFDEAVLTGGIGAAKTSLALYSQAYQLYLLSCLENPQITFGLDSSSEIKIIFQSLRKSTAAGVDFNRFFSMIGSSDYFKEMFPFEKGLTSIMKFPNRIESEPVSGSETAAIGQNIIGGVIDEVNFMSVIENSKQSIDGGVYNQAIELYNSIARRRKSRFMVAGGGMPGVLCVVSSKRIPGEFTDVKMEEAKTNPRIYVYDKRVWDVKPYSFSGETFSIFIGDESRRPKVIEPGDRYSEEDEHLIDQIPIEFSQEFKEDITKAVRDIAGHSTLAASPFLTNSEKVRNCFGKSKNICLDDWVDFHVVKCALSKDRIVDPHLPRYAHIDLSVTSDSTGLVIGHVHSFSELGEVKEMRPQIKIDLVLEIRPPRNGEIEFSKIREILYALTSFGMNIKWVSFDSYQSRDSIQILRQKGYSSGNLSMDTSRDPYETLKQAFYDERISVPIHKKLLKELLALEIDYKRNKIDHNAHNSKDISDALAGVVYGLTNRREIWSYFGVRPTNLSTSTEKSMQEKDKTSET